MAEETAFILNGLSFLLHGFPLPGLLLHAILFFAGLHLGGVRTGSGGLWLVRPDGVGGWFGWQLGLLRGYLPARLAVQIRSDHEKRQHQAAGDQQGG